MSVSDSEPRLLCHHFSTAWIPVFWQNHLQPSKTDSIVVLPTRAKKKPQYGTMVRVGPNKVSISDPEVIPIIYNIGSKYTKSDP